MRGECAWFLSADSARNVDPEAVCPRCSDYPSEPMAKPKVVLPGLFNRAAAAANGGDLAEAERLYRAILGVRPGQPEALHSLNVVRYQRGAPDEALTLIERAGDGMRYSIGSRRNSISWRRTARNRRCDSAGGPWPASASSIFLAIAAVAHRSFDAGGGHHRLRQHS